MFVKLLAELQRQVAEHFLFNEVQIDWLEDNKEISVGRKRQLLLENASGGFVVGFDSDDWPAQDYVISIVSAIKSNPNIDHVGFYELCTFNGERPRLSLFSIRYHKWGENVDGHHYIRCANPKSVIRREKALQVGFEDSRFGEDIKFSEAVTPLLVSEVFIDKILYHYRYVDTEFNERYGIANI